MGKYYAEITLVKEECWRCHSQYLLYIIKKIVDEQGEQIDCLSYNQFTFDTRLAKKVEDYLSQKLELGLRLGPVKVRHSNTVQSDYPSFGCPNCDAIYGDFYYKELLMEYEYCESEYDDILIDVSEMVCLGR